MSAANKKSAGKLGVLLLLSGAVLAAIFHLSFSPPFVLFSSDGPLGYIASQWEWAGDSFKGFWQDLNWIGSEQPSASPNVTMGLFFLLGPVAFLKFYVPITLLLLAVAAWFLFRQFGFSWPVCVLGGFAAAFNTHPFSFGCWGLGSLILTFAFSFFAMGLLASPRRSVLHVILAGFCIGMGVVEGFDNGAIMSIYAAIWLVFLAFQSGTEKPKQLARASVLVALMAVCAALLATHTLRALITTQIQGVEGAQQDAQTKEQRWDWATQWSLPKVEVLRVIVPGLFGYRMDTPDGGEYWGTVGRQPGWEDHHQGMIRHSGAGEYAGVLVCVLALYALACAFGKSKTLTTVERRIIWFWAVVAVVSLLLSFGRHAPFYQLLYPLPYFSTIRNPIKFTLPFQMALLVLFAFGLQCLYRKYEQCVVQRAKSTSEALRTWWKSAAPYERIYARGLLALLAVFVIGYLIYYSSAPEVRRYLTANAFVDASAAAIHKFSLTEVRWTLLFLACSLAAVFLALAGWFTGERAKWLTVTLGLILVVDLYRANVPWVIYYNYKDKYEENSLLAALKDRAFERRVTAKLHPLGHYLPSPQSQILPGIYNEWLQHQFQYYRVHSLDISQMPRIPQLDHDFFNAFTPKNDSQIRLARRLWEPTNTRWILAEKGLLPTLNQTMDPQKNRFRVLSEFNFTVKEGRMRATTFDDLRPEPATNGMYAIIEFTGALPRAKFFTSWQVATNDAAALAELALESFDPQESVIVHGTVPAPASTNVVAGQTNTVHVLSYQPREWQLRVENAAPGILLLNDRFDDDWKLTVNGKPENALRLNYLMRGVYLEPGNNTVVFSYSVPQRGFYLSLISIVAAILIAGYLGFSSKRKDLPETRAQPSKDAEK